MRNFKSIKIKDMDSLLSELDKEGTKAIILAGGTNVSNYIKQGRLTEGTLLDISDLKDLKGISEENGMIKIGAATTISEILDSKLAVQGVPFLTESLRKFANPLIRNMATIGGNIADASPVADAAPLLLVTDALILTTGKDGVREIPVNLFFNQPRKTNLKPNEIITHILIPFQKDGTGTFLKMGERNSSAISVVSAAVFMHRKENKINSIRIALGGVAPKPLRGEKTETSFTGQSVNAEDIRRLSKNIMEEISPISDIRGSSQWRKELTANLVARAVRICLGMEE